MKKILKNMFCCSEKKLIIKIKELDLKLTNAKNRDIKHLESVAIDIVMCDKKTKDPLTLLYITKYSSLNNDRVNDLSESIDMGNPFNINIAMGMANNGYSNNHIVKKVLSTKITNHNQTIKN